MMATSGVTLTPEQAAMLLPLIQQIAAGQNCTPGSPSSSSTYSSSSPGSRLLSPLPLASPPSVFSDGESSGFSATELLRKKSKNTKSSDAQIHLLVSFSILKKYSCVCVCVWCALVRLDCVGTYVNTMESIFEEGNVFDFLDTGPI